MKRKLIIRYSKKARYKSGLFQKIGSSDWTRTSDIRINSPPFYRLNYRGIAVEAHLNGEKIFCQTRFFKFPNCLPFLSTVCCICRQFVGENLCSFADSPSLFEMWFHFLQLRSALNISSALRQVVHGTRWHAKRKSYKVLFWREITPACCSYLHGECLCPVDGGF